MWCVVSAWLIIHVPTLNVFVHVFNHVVDLQKKKIDLKIHLLFPTWLLFWDSFWCSYASTCTSTDILYYIVGLYIIMCVIHNYTLNMHIICIIHFTLALKMTRASGSKHQWKFFFPFKAVYREPFHINFEYMQALDLKCVDIAIFVPWCSPVLNIVKSSLPCNSHNQ